ncbi:MAG: hypothetical protein N2204_03250, partial [Anaerolineae bacterium]|nr:hypothetical protein [Anaerolineae bacterium]
MSAPLEYERAWAQERTRWHAYHLVQLEANLEQIRAVVVQEPGRLAEHGASVLTVLNQARQVPHLHERVLDLLLALDPWPKRWGYGTDWAALLHYGAEMAALQGDAYRRAALLSALADCQANLGQIQAAQTAAHTALELALQVGALDILCLLYTSPSPRD